MKKKGVSKPLRNRKRRGLQEQKSKRKGAPSKRKFEILCKLPTALYRDRAEFEAVLEGAGKKSGLKLSAPVSKTILSALSERDETATISLGNGGSDMVSHDEFRPVADIGKIFSSFFPPKRV